MKKSTKLSLPFILLLMLMLFVYIEYEDLILDTLDITIPELQELTQEEPIEEIIIIHPNVSTLSIASWNIQNFGQSKARNEPIIDEIVQRIIEYDIIAIQEITNVNEKVDLNCDRNENAHNHQNFRVIRTALEEGFDRFNATNYRIKISPHVFNERYMYVYDSTKTNLLESYFVEDYNTSQICQMDRDHAGLMLREPYVGVFYINETTNLTLMNVHTSPSSNHDELMSLKYFYDKELLKHDYVLLLGDLNFGCSYYPDFNMFNESIFIFGDDANTNVAQSQCAYDRMLYDEPFFGTFVEKGIDTTITRNISDHYLIWTQLALN